MLLCDRPHVDESILPIASVISFSTGSICEPPSIYSELLCTGTCLPSPSTANWFVTDEAQSAEDGSTPVCHRKFLYVK